MINFNKPPYVGEEIDHIRKAIESQKICGDGEYTKLCNQWIENKTGCAKALLTTSCTHALEIAAILCDIHQGDEIIMPSYTFVSTANAFLLRGAKIVFVDIRPDTMNIDENLIEQAITEKTKVIVPVHYAGVACEMETIMNIAKHYGLFVVEDAAQGAMATYKGRALGTIGDFGCYSFHETKNYSMGEGGALLINHEKYIERAEIIREKGTNRSKFWRGQLDKYTWVDIGSSYLPSELNAAYLYPQLESAEKINQNRLEIWQRYYDGLIELVDRGIFQFQTIPKECQHNGHMFLLKVKSIEERSKLISFLKEKEIMTVFHYIPLHNSPFGKLYGKFNGEDVYTTSESERLVRLPMFYGLENKSIDYIVKNIYQYFKNIAII